MTAITSFLKPVSPRTNERETAIMIATALSIPNTVSMDELVIELRYCWERRASGLEIMMHFTFVFLGKPV